MSRWDERGWEQGGPGPFWSCPLSKNLNPCVQGTLFSSARPHSCLLSYCTLLRWALCCPCLYLPASAGAIPYVILYLCWLLHLLSKAGPEKPHNQLSSHHVSGKGCPWRRQLTIPCLLPRSPPATLRHYALVEQGPWLPCPQNKPVNAELNSVCICICLNRVLLCSSG